MPLRSDQDLEDVAQAPLIIDDEDATHRYSYHPKPE